jgi:hypothetical protein
MDLIEPTRVAERIEGGGEAPYGKTSFQRTAEAPTPARTQAARAVEPDASLRVTDTEVSPATSRFIEEWQKPDGKVSNRSDSPDVVTTEKTGLEVKNLADLEALLKANNESRSFLQEVRAKRQRGEPLTPEEQARYMAQGMRVQFPREVVEVATNSGAWSEAKQAAMKRPIGERPLDWQKNPQVAEWLKKHGEELGMDVSDIQVNEGSLKAEPKTTDLTETVLNDDVIGEVGKLKQEFPGGLEVVIVDSYQKLPDSIHQTAYRQGANPMGVSGAVSGGKVYINSANIGSLAEVRQIFLHEQHQLPLLD